MNKVASDFLYNDKSKLNFIVSENLKNAPTSEYKSRIMKNALVKIIENDLSEKQRTYLCLYFFDGLSMTDIAKKYGVNKSTVSRLIKKAQNRIGSRMDFLI
ncbi:MAG: sigma-70 family RNA polymerase sigma factor [Oscillospiraceae bacterium]